MTDVYVSTHWHVDSGREQEFTEVWREALTWTKQTFGAGLERARLLRNEEDASHFVSFIEWADRDTRERWFGDPGFEQRITKLEALCTEANGASYEEAVKIA